MFKYLKNIVCILIVLSIIYTHSTLFACQDLLRQTATQATTQARDDIGREIGRGSTRHQAAPALIALEDTRVCQKGITITERYARIGNIFFLRPDTTGSIITNDRDDESIIINLKGLSFHPQTDRDTGNIVDYVYGQGTIALIMALQALKEQLGAEEFNKLVFLDAGAGTGILSIVAAKLGAGSVIAIDDDSEYDQLSERERNDPTAPRTVSQPYHQLIQDNIRLNGVESLVTARNQNLWNLQPESYPENPNVLMLNMRYFGSRLTDRILSSIKARYALIAGEPKNKGDEYNFMIPEGVGLKNFSTPNSFQKELERRGIAITAFGQVLFANSWPALVYEVQSSPEAMQEKTSSAGEDSVFEALHSMPIGDLSYNLSATTSSRSLVSMTTPPGDRGHDMVDIRDFGLSTAATYPFLRRAIAEDLRTVDAWLRQRGLCLHIGDALRTLEIQQKRKDDYIKKESVGLFGEKLQRLLQKAETHFSDAHPNAPHLSGGAFDIEIWQIAAGKRIASKAWEAFGQRPDLTVEADIQMFDMSLKESYKPVEDYIKETAEPLDVRIMLLAGNRRFLYNILTRSTAEGGILASGHTFYAHPQEFWHFGRGDRASGVFYGVNAYYDMVNPEIIEQLVIRKLSSAGTAPETFTRNRSNRIHRELSAAA